MFTDALLRVSNAQAVTVDAVSVDSIDLGDVTPKRQIGDGRVMGFAMSVGVAADFTTGDETYIFEVIQSANANLSSPTIIASYQRTAGPPGALALLGAGSLHFFPIPPGFPTARYIGLNYNTGGTSPSITVTAWLCSADEFAVLAQRYADGYVV